MRAERIILSFVAILIGLLAAGGVFYLYQMTKVVPPEKTKTPVVKAITPSPTPNTTDFITVDNPQDESVVSNKTLTITGKTSSDATIVVNSDIDDEVAKPASNGQFSLSMPLDNGTNLIHITAIFGNGEEKQVTRVVTFSTESF